jgi:hypothetical protein
MKNPESKVREIPITTPAGPMEEINTDSAIQRILFAEINA